MKIKIAILLIVSVACSRSRDPETRSLLDAKMKCARQGEEWLAKVTEKETNAGEIVSGGQFTYDRALDTCLSYYYVHRNGTVLAEVTDTLTGKDILNFITHSGANASPGDASGVDNREGATPVRDLTDFNARVRALGFNP